MSDEKRAQQRFDPIDLKRVRTYPLKRRKSKVAAAELASVLPSSARVTDLLASLPDVLAARDLRTIAQTIADRHRRGRLIVLGMGAHPIKVGLSPLIIDLMRRGIVSAVALNGAAIIHDFEMAFHGATSEDVGPGLADGSFGMAEETGRFLNTAINSQPGVGLGTAVGTAIRAAKMRHGDLSILAAGIALNVPVTVHVAIGTDIIHMHPSADGAATGAATLADFRRLAAVIAGLNQGVFLNLGSAVIIPETFLKALNLARNVGHHVSRLVTVNMDFLRHYRPAVNVVQRPTERDGRGYHLTGHHEIMFPLLCAAIEAALARKRKAKR